MQGVWNQTQNLSTAQHILKDKSRTKNEQTRNKIYAPFRACPIGLTDNDLRSGGETFLLYPIPQNIPGINPLKRL
ncbi:hypothetical protein GCM10011273_07430 [Asticcacaulis endophyticus]|uniref:Uncharacterized protein n=1 Tax=Asticcacaulis endophyticus TaxID=1395890 RepID=A0A918PXQ0_9CAUL|nr:hypothetical protein GCM10011273_07430 [Asticcacaulis endophyticus]